MYLRQGLTEEKVSAGVNRAGLLIFEEKRDLSSEHRLDSSQVLIHSASCEMKFFSNAKVRLIKSAKPSPYEERTQAPGDSIEFLQDQRKHLQGTGASTSFKSIVLLLYLYCGETIILFLVHRSIGFWFSRRPY